MHSFQEFIVVSFPTTLPYGNKDVEIICESTGGGGELYQLVTQACPPPKKNISSTVSDSQCQSIILITLSSLIMFSAVQQWSCC